MSPYACAPKSRNRRRSVRSTVPPRTTNPPEQPVSLPARENSPSPDTCAAAPVETAQPAGTSPAPGAWFIDLAREAGYDNPKEYEKKLLEDQSGYAAIVTHPRKGSNEAFKQYNRTNQANVNVALFVYGNLGGEVANPGIALAAFTALERHCRAIALAQGLREYGTLDAHCYTAACDNLLLECLKKYKDALETAYLLLLDRMPDGRRANYGEILYQRILAEMGYSKYRTYEKQWMAGIDADDPMSPDIPPQTISLEEAEKEGVDIDALPRYGQVNEVASVEAINDDLRAKLSSDDIKLWQVGSEVDSDPSYTWDDAARDHYTDPKTGKALSAATLRKRWSRLQARIKRDYKELTGRDYPTG